MNDMKHDHNVQIQQSLDKLRQDLLKSLGGSPKMLEAAHVPGTNDILRRNVIRMGYLEGRIMSFTKQRGVDPELFWQRVQDLQLTTSHTFESAFEEIRAAYLRGELR